MPYQSIMFLFQRLSTFKSSTQLFKHQRQSVLYLMIIVLICILSLPFTSVITIVRAQYAIASSNKYFAGMYTLSFNSSLPISVGTSPFSDTNTNTSVVYNGIIKYSSRETDKVVIITGTSSSGDYLIFTAPTEFTVDFEMTIGFETLNIGKRTVYIPSYGFQRFFSQKQVRKGKHNNLVLMSGNVNQQIGGSQTIHVGFAFNNTEQVQFTPYTLSSLNYKMLEIDVPNDVPELDEKHYVPFYLHIQCVESELCRLVINLFNVEDDAPYLGTIFGIVMASFAICLLLALCVVIGSIIHRRRRGVPIIAYIEPQKIQTMSTVQYYSPTMQPLSSNTATVVAQEPTVACNYFSAEAGVVVYQPPEPTQVVLTSQDVHQYDSKV